MTSGRTGTKDHLRERRLVRKALVESTLLSIIGGVLGIGIAFGGSKLILYLAFHNGAGPANYVPVDASPSWPCSSC